MVWVVTIGDKDGLKYLQQVSPRHKLVLDLWTHYMTHIMSHPMIKVKFSTGLELVLYAKLEI